MPDQSATHTTDRQLLRRVAGGDEQAFELLYQHHSTPLYNYLLHLIHEPTVAEELLQEIFVAVWQGADRFRGQAKVTTWLFRIAHNRAVSWLRKQRQVLALDDLTGPSEPFVDDAPEELVMEAWRADQVRLALAHLSPNHRAVLELTFFYNFSYAEIAEIVGCPVGTVKSRMSHARRYMSHALKNMEFER